jgi:hypothetical protein
VLAYLVVGTAPRSSHVFSLSSASPARKWRKWCPETPKIVDLQGLDQVWDLTGGVAETDGDATTLSQHRH